MDLETTTTVIVLEDGTAVPVADTKEEVAAKMGLIPVSNMGGKVVYINPAKVSFAGDMPPAEDAPKLELL